ncbi:SDR family oxidoreductase [Panacibacter ginsenosidivorans]|uniref:SDR family oxidoreductase n=1 Tax=Panacibacter ginsenosidivorans TaxID=1813871 RepID=A0A5B8V8B0_9BACT|nr:SDR family oxidoreductase [Panacibacter ginsenosidivorans]QEC67770.1 SDR family oxidoreductase [Panacibacter ginsenosidivorans]
MDLSLQGKTALVCGSTQGIGLATAIELSALGANCVLMARNEKALQEAIAQLDTSVGQQHTYLVADFSKPHEVKEAIEAFTKLHIIHIVINNTGGPKAGPIVDADEEAFRIAFNQHVVCNQIIAKTVIPCMKREGYGRIINIISTSVKIPLSNLGVSNTIRGAVASWAKTMANELGQFNITVNNILPGMTKTNRLESLILNTAAIKKITAETVRENMQQEIPMKRFGEATEIANVIAFLASPAASYVNGASLPVDGGRTGSI